MKKLSKCLLLCVLISFISCENDDQDSNNPENNNPEIVDFTENFGTSITASFTGRVIDEQNQPVEGATIKVGNTFTTTDAFGVFRIENTNAFERFAYITAEKTGYIVGSRSLIPLETEINYVEIMLLEENVIATINSGENSTVDLNNGTSVGFEGNFVTESGSAYSGAVEVVLKHLSPDNENMDLMMPGMLFAQTSNGRAVTLETYGMLAVELRSTGGEELQLAEGSSSQISMPLAANATNPPASIPLWYFDETQGYWVEEGQATLQGNVYVGDVSHFTFWNYDYPYPSVYLCITLQDSNGNVLPYTALDLYSSLLNNTGTYGYTDSTGEECGLVPADEELIVTVPSALCANDTFSTTIGPFSSDSNITVTVISQDNAATFTGTFLTCDGNNVTNGYIQLFIDGISQIIPVSDGDFNYTLTICEATDYSLKGVDIDNNQVTDLISGTLNENTTIDLGILSACVGFEDSDNDGVFDIYEDINGDNDLTNDDTDQDDIPNYLDEDDDGDGINTADEDYDGDNDPTNDDTDEDGIPDYLDAQDVVVFNTEVPGQGCDPVTFDLDFIVNEFLDAPNTTYEFYPTEADAMAETNILTSPYTIPFAQMVSGIQMIFIRATNTINGQSAIAMLYLYLEYIDSDQDGLTDCEEILGIDDPATPLVPNGTSDPNDPNDPNMSGSFPQEGVLSVCDFDNDGFEAFDLTVMDTYYTSGNSGFIVSYHETVDDAENGINALPSPYTNFTNPQFLYVRIEGINSQEFQISTLILNIDFGPTILQTVTMTNCDGDGDGFATFDLTQVIPEVLGPLAPEDFAVTFHLTQLDADNGTNAIANPGGYTNTSNPELVFIRVETLNSDCYSTGVIELIVESGC